MQEATSVFRVPVFQLVDVGVGSQFGHVRVVDKQNRLFDFKLGLSDSALLPMVQKGIDNNVGEMFDIAVGTSNYMGALVRPNPDGTLPPIGTCIGESVKGELSTRGRIVSCEHAGMSSVASNPELRDNTVLSQDMTPGTPLNRTDLSDRDMQDSIALSKAGSTGGPGGYSSGVGIYMSNTSNKGHQSHSVESTTSSTQEQGHAGGMMSTAPNFLQHYFVGIANAVALPMPHMVDIIKMVAIGVFIKKIIGTKGSRNATTGKWEGASGVYGLADTLVDTVKKK